MQETIINLILINTAINSDTSVQRCLRVAHNVIMNRVISEYFDIGKK